jgi:bis(5'-nucleosidyl)-tetraphosphatase
VIENMWVTRNQLRRLIHEEISRLLSEVIKEPDLPRNPRRGSFPKRYGSAHEREEVFSAGVLIIDGDDVLVLRAYRNWGFPKGHVEPGEGLLDAAIRETQEETTLVAGEDYILTGGDDLVSITYKTSERDKTTGKSRTVLKTATYFLATRASDKEPFLPVSDELGRPENDEWRWVPISSLGNTDPEAGIVFSDRLMPVLSYLTSYVEGGNREELSEPQMTRQDEFDKAVLDGADPMNPDFRARYPDVESTGTEAATQYLKRKFD